MQKLSKDWFTDGTIDFELKKYTLLAYLQEVNRDFHVNRLYPQLADLVFHFNNMNLFKENKEYLQNNFPERLTNADMKNLKLSYQRMVHDDNLMTAIGEIIDYSLTEMNKSLDEGKAIYEFVEASLNLFPVGLVNLYPDEGYLFLKNGHHKETMIYEYHITLYENANEKFRGISTSYVGSYTEDLLNTFESIKLDLIRNIPKMPNPAVYVAESEMSFPVEETLLPIAKRSLVRYIAATTI